MKRCPQCGREYDNSMMFCLDDGAELLYGPASMDEPATAILHSTAAPGEAPTRAQIDLTNETAVLPSGSETQPRTKAGSKQWQLAALAVAFLILAVGGLLGYRYFSASGAKQINSIAVMPFENRNSDADTDYLSDGLAESVIFRLTQLPDLRVSPTSSVMRYKGASTDVAKIASELGVDAVMTGRLTKRGDNLNITVELVDARTNKSLWGEQYERKLSELLTTQREIVAEIVSKLQLKLSGESEQKLAKKYTNNDEAYQLYLQGRYHWNKRQADEFEKAIVFFKQAIAKDPNYALAYSGLADTYALIPAYGDFRAKEYYPQAKQAVQKSLELDPNLAEAHASLGQILLYGDYDIAGAERAYKRAIELNPNYATARMWYGEVLSINRKHDEAIKELSIALELEPFSMIINREMTKYLIFARRFDEALLQNKKVNELFPNQSAFHGGNGDIYLAQGKYDKAFEEYTLSWKANKEFKPEELQARLDAYQKGGWEGFNKLDWEEYLKFLNEEQAKDKNGYVSAMSYAFAYGNLKDKDKTIEFLNKAFEERVLALLYLNVEFTWDFVRDDPRFKELVKRVGIPE